MQEFFRLFESFVCLTQIFDNTLTHQCVYAWFWIKGLHLSCQQLIRLVRLRTDTIIWPLSSWVFIIWAASPVFAVLHDFECHTSKVFSHYHICSEVDFYAHSCTFVLNAFQFLALSGQLFLNIVRWVLIYCIGYLSLEVTHFFLVKTAIIDGRKTSHILRSRRLTSRLKFLIWCNRSRIIR